MSNKVLIIDDDEVIRDAFKIALKSEYEVILAEDGYQGVDMAKNDQPQLIFLDLKMPGMSGVEVLSAIREFDMDTPIFIVTAFYKDYLIPLETLSKNGTPFQLAQKPLSGDQIRSIANAALPNN